MPIKKVSFYLLNIVFALFMGYLYLGVAIKAAAILIICVILATYLAILNHQKNKSKFAIFFLDLLLSFCVPFMLLAITMVIYGIADIVQNTGPDVGFFQSTLLSLFISFMGGIYALPAWLPWGIANFFLLNYSLK